MNSNLRRLVLASLLACFAFAPVVQAKTGELKAADADSALSQLKEGNRRFLSGELRKDGLNKTDVVRLSAGQAPNSVVLSCSDSRVPPELIFDQKLGEMFTVRSAGEALSPQ